MEATNHSTEAGDSGNRHPDQANRLALLNVAEVAKRLGVSPGFVYARVADGSLPHYRLGNGQGGIRVSEEQITAFLEGCGLSHVLITRHSWR